MTWDTPRFTIETHVDYYGDDTYLLCHGGDTVAALTAPEAAALEPLLAYQDIYDPIDDDDDTPERSL